jgi:transposase
MLLGCDKRCRSVDSARVAMENGTHSTSASEQIKELGHEVIVGNVRELLAISHSNVRVARSCRKDRTLCAGCSRDPPAVRPPDRGSAGDVDNNSRPDVLVRLQGI